MSEHPEDCELLRRYILEQSEPAFADLVRRHVDLVYSAALRQTGGDPHRAQEVTQMTFTILARRAAQLLNHPVLPAWLYRTAANCAAMNRRTESRRARHEGRAAMEPTAAGLGWAGAGTGTAPDEAPFAGAAGGDGDAAVEWGRLRPVLDQVMEELDERDRRALLLRFFCNEGYGAVGRRLGLSENAARMRVTRSLDKLRERLARRGVTSTAAALGVILGEQAVSAAPVGIAASVSALALSAGPLAGAAASAAGAVGAAGGGALTGGGWLAFMSMTKVQIGIWAGVAATGAAVLGAQQHTFARLGGEVSNLRAHLSEVGALRAQNAQLQRSLNRDRDLSAAATNNPALVGPLRIQLKELNETISGLEAAKRAKAPAVPPLRAKNGELVYSVANEDVRPALTAQAPPQYPFEMRRAGLSGSATVDFEVSAQGTVENAQVVNTTQKEFAAAALEAVNKWRFSPGQVAGSAVTTHMQVPIVFSLNDEEGQPPGPTDWFPAAKAPTGRL